MTDRATQSLAQITAPSGDYVCIPGLVIFDEHKEYDRNGRLLRKFGRQELQTIADKCNRREATTGDLAPGGPGHTIESPKSEEDQPPIWGFARNYRVESFGPQGKLGLVCDYYVQKTIETKDGRKVDGKQYALSFPRRSIELWPNHPSIPEHARNTVDWIGFLRRSPQRDLGLSIYGRAANAADGAIPVVHTHFSPDRSIVGGMTRSGKLCYSMESAMPDVANPVDDPSADTSTNFDADGDAGGDAGDGGDMPPDGHEDFAKHLEYAMSNHPHLKHLGAMCKKYGMEEGIGGGATPAAPGATNAAPPGSPPADDDTIPEIGRNARPGSGDVQKTKYQLQLEAHEDRIKKAEQHLLLEQQRIRIEKYQMTLEGLSDEYEIDLAAEMDEGSGFNQKQMDARVALIKRAYSRTPVGGDLPFDAIEKTPGQQKTLDDPEVAQKCFRYMRDNPEFQQKHGQNAFVEAAKALKIIG